MKMFDRDGLGADEIVSVVGLISNDVTFDKWAPLLPLGERDLKAIIGDEVVDAISSGYQDGEDLRDESFRHILVPAQQTVAYFTWLKIIPTLDAQHDNTGRQRRLGENEKGLTALQEWKDEENIRHLAYESADSLIAMMEGSEYRPWLESRKYKQREGLILKDKATFDEYYHIGSHRLFVTLLPIIREVQCTHVAPVLGPEHLAEVLEQGENSPLYDSAARAVALLSIKKAVERLPIEVIPEGVVQMQQSQPVKQRLKAEQEARAAVSASLGADAGRYLEHLQALVAGIDAEGREYDDSVQGPIVHSRGMTF